MLSSNAAARLLSSLSAFSGALPVWRAPKRKSGGHYDPPPVEIIPPEYREPVRVYWRDHHGYIHVREFACLDLANKFAAQLLCRLLIDDWRKNCERAIALTPTVRNNNKAVSR
jgi:hypothetical protein